MQKELIKVRCAQGSLIITEELISVELGLGQLKKQTLQRSALTGAEIERGMIPSLLGKGGSANLIFRGQGAERIRVTMVKREEAKKVMEILGY